MTIPHAGALHPFRFHTDDPTASLPSRSSPPLSCGGSVFVQPETTMPTIIMYYDAPTMPSDAGGVTAHLISGLVAQGLPDEVGGRNCK